MSTQPRFQLLAPLRADEYEALKADIAKRGVLVAVEVDADSGEILDGHHRVQIAGELGIGYETVGRSFATDAERVEHAIKLNLLRRHMDDVTWAEQFEKLAEVRGVRLGKGGDRRSPESTDTVAVDSLAAELGVSERTAQRRRELLEAPPEIQEKVRAGDMSGAEARRHAKRQQREDEQREGLRTPALPTGVFDVILADPPWAYDHSVSNGRRIENQYPTMTLDELAGVDVPAGDTAVLFMWATSPKLADALDLMAAWGFEYRTSLVWVKDKIGMGYYARSRHELLLVGNRGGASPPLPEARPDSVIEAPRGKHSAKPVIVYELLERMYPNGSRCELFARNEREGWSSWGNEV